MTAQQYLLATQLDSFDIDWGTVLLWSLKWSKLGNELLFSFLFSTKDKFGGSIRH